MVLPHSLNAKKKRWFDLNFLGSRIKFRELNDAMGGAHSPIYSALDSPSSPTIVGEGGEPFDCGRTESPFPALPLWQAGQDPFEAALSAAVVSDPVEEQAPPAAPLVSLTAQERGLPAAEDDGAELEELNRQIQTATEFLALVQEDARLAGERAAQIQLRWRCKGYISLKLINQYPHQFEKPSTWDTDVQDLTARLDAENRAEVQLRDILKLQEECLRGNILPAIATARQQQLDMLRNVQDATASLRSERAAVTAKLLTAMALKTRRNTCVAIVNSVYQAMRREERIREEIDRGRESLQARAADDSIRAQFVRCKAEIEREKAHLRDLIAANTVLQASVESRTSASSSPTSQWSADSQSSGQSGGTCSDPIITMFNDKTTHAAVRSTLANSPTAGPLQARKGNVLSATAPQRTNRVAAPQLLGPENHFC